MSLTLLICANFSPHLPISSPSPSTFRGRTFWIFLFRRQKSTTKEKRKKKTKRGKYTRLRFNHRGLHCSVLHSGPTSPQFSGCLQQPEAVCDRPESVSFHQHSRTQLAHETIEPIVISLVDHPSPSNHSREFGLSGSRWRRFNSSPKLSREPLQR